MSSINVQNHLSDASFMAQILGQAKAEDGKSFLYDDLVDPAIAKELANAAGQPVTVELHAEGAIKTMADGTQYQVTKRGWRKV